MANLIKEIWNNSNLTPKSTSSKYQAQKNQIIKLL